MKYLYKDQFKKIKNNLFYFISLGTIIFLITLTFTAVTVSVDRLTENKDTYLEEQYLEDFYFSLGEVDINYLSGSALLELCTELSLTYECGIALANPADTIYINNLNITINDAIKDNPDIYENITDRYVTIFEDRYDYVVEKGYTTNIIDDDYIYKFVSMKDTVSVPYLIDGTLPVEDYEIAVFPEFLENNNLTIGQSYLIDDTTYTITGTVYQPDFLFPIMSLTTIEFNPVYQTIVLTNKNTLDNLNQYLFTKYHVKGDLTKIIDAATYDDLITFDKSILGKNMQMIEMIYPSSINFRISAIETEATTAKAFIDIFLPMFYFLTGILLIIFLKGYIDQNKKDINTLVRIGYTKKEITKAMMVFPFLVSLFALIGYILGLVLSMSLFDLYSARYLFPKSPFSLTLIPFLKGVIIPFIFINLVSYLFLSSTIFKKKKTVYKTSFRLFRFVPIKTILTTFTLFLTMSILMIFGLNGNQMFGHFVDTTSLGNDYYEMVNLEYITNEPYDENYESYTKIRTQVTTLNNDEISPVSTMLYGIKPSTSLKKLINNDSDNNQLLTDGVIISQYLASLMDINAGDTLSFKVGETLITKEVKGISNELIESNIFIEQETLNGLYGLSTDYYNGLFADDDLYESPYVTSRIRYKEAMNEFESIINVSNLIINYLVILSVILALYIFILIIINFLHDQIVDIALLKSLGFTNKEIHVKYLLPLYIIFIISFIIAVPITIYLLQFLLDQITDIVGFRLLFTVDYLYLFIGFIGMNLMMVFLIKGSNLFYNKIKLSETLKKEKS